MTREVSFMRKLVGVLVCVVGPDVFDLVLHLRPIGQFDVARSLARTDCDVVCDASENLVELAAALLMYGEAVVGVESRRSSAESPEESWRAALHPNRGCPA